MSKWIGEPPTHCDICKKPLVGCFVDGKMVAGPWANMCQPCFNQFGVGLGAGKGQKYWLEDESVDQTRNHPSSN